MVPYTYYMRTDFEDSSGKEDCVKGYVGTSGTGDQLLVMSSVSTGRNNGSLL